MQAVAQAEFDLRQAFEAMADDVLIGHANATVQLHGGIGVTDEYIVSHCFKRLTQIELSLGDSLHHLGQVSAQMQETAGVFA